MNSLKYKVLIGTWIASNYGKVWKATSDKKETTKREVGENYESSNMKNDDAVFAVKLGLWDVPYCIV